MAKEYKSYDSSCYVEFFNAKIAMPVEVRDGDNGPLVRFKVVASSKNTERFTDCWLEVNVGRFNALAASYLRKGDVVSCRGRLAMRTWGDDNDKVALSLEYAELMIPAALIGELKERGFEPDGEPGPGGDESGEGGSKDGGKKNSKKPDNKKAGNKAKPTGNAKKPEKKKPDPIDIPDDEEEEGSDDDSDDSDEE